MEVIEIKGHHLGLLRRVPCHGRAGFARTHTHAHTHLPTLPSGEAPVGPSVLGWNAACPASPAAFPACAPGTCDTLCWATHAPGRTHCHLHPDLFP